MRIALAFTLLLLLAGCGSSTHTVAGNSAYEHRMAALVPPLQSDLLKGRFALENVHVPSVGRIELRHIELELRVTIAGLQQLTPPRAVAADHAALIAAYRSTLGDFKALEADTRGVSTDKLRVAAAKLESAPAQHEVGTRLQAIIAKGYDLGFPAGS